MPVFVAAVKLKRNRRCCSSSTVSASHSASGEPSLATSLGGPDDPSIPEEYNCIKRNLRKYFRDFESETERILKSNTLSASGGKRANMSSKQQNCFEEEGRYSPVGMEDERSSSPTSGEAATIIPNGIEKSFKARRSFNSRQRDVEEIMRKHPNKVPIIVERSKSEKALDVLDKSKFLVPDELTMSQLNTIIRRRLQLTDSQAFYLMINRRSMTSSSAVLTEVYRTEKDTDGFLYITYASQEMFG